MKLAANFHHTTLYTGVAKAVIGRNVSWFLCGSKGDSPLSGAFLRADGCQHINAGSETPDSTRDMGVYECLGSCACVSTEYLVGRGRRKNGGLSVALGLSSLFGRRF